MVVLDAWPVVEYYEGNDPSAAEVEGLLDDDSVTVVMSSVNVAEVYSAVASNAENFYKALAFMRDLREVVLVLEPTFEIAELAALLKHCYHMSLGDSFAAATSIAFSSGQWPWPADEQTHEEPESYIELWTGDLELLCANRVWRVRDLRTPAQQQGHASAISRGSKKVGLRTNAQTGWSMLRHPSGMVYAAQDSIQFAMREEEA